MAQNLKVVIVGGVACGPKAASRLKRIVPSAEVTMIDRGKRISYGACGLPYVVSGVASRIEALWETPMGVERSPAFFKKVKGFDALVETEVTRIDREKKQVEATHLPTGGKKTIPYDKLVLATGGVPFLPPIKNLDLKGVGFMNHPDDAVQLKARLEKGDIRKAVIVGSGLIGVEMMEALVSCKVEVVALEMLDYVMGTMLDEEIARLAMKHIASNGVCLVMGEKVEEFLGDREGRLTGVRTRNKTFEADYALVAAGVKPRGELAREAELHTHSSGAIAINEFCQTSDPDIYAGGDCTANGFLPRLTGEAIYTPQGSTANKHGRIIANHIAGLPEPFHGVMGTVVCKAFDFTIGRTGLTEMHARSLNYDVESALWAGPDLPHYYPGWKPLIIKLVAGRKNRRLLGCQVVGPGEGSKRLDVAAAAISFGATVDFLSQLDLGYAPPYSPALDPLHTAAHVLQNKLDKVTRGISPLEVKEKLDRGDKDFVFLDVRSPQEWEVMHLPYEERTIRVPLGVLRERLGELPRDKKIIALCKISLRGYEAERILSGAGFQNAAFLEGGIIGWPYEVWTGDA